MFRVSARLSSVARRPYVALATMIAVAALGVSIPGGAAGAKPRTGRRQPSGEAPGGPGAQSYLDEARKDCFGTARDTTSKVWFTVADGVLSDVFSPTIENSNVNTVQYIVTDGRTFAAEQQRDMSYSVSSPDRSGMVCRVTSTDRAHQLHN
jgi:glucoamylase